MQIMIKADSAFAKRPGKPNADWRSVDVNQANN